MLIEDSCEALGTVIDNNKTGNFGRAASFSFFVTHHMTTIEGGMISTNNKKLWLKIWSLKDHGKYYNSVFNLPS